MTRSGIKQGLAASAVGALAITGLGFTAAANAATPTYTITQSATSVSTNETATVTISSSDAAAVNATSVSASEAVPAVTGGAAAHTNPVTVTPTGTATTTDDGAGETLTFTAPAEAGTITLSFVDGNQTNHVLTVTVGGGKSDAASVSSLKTNSSSFSLYQGDLAGTNLSVRPVDAAGFGVANATVRFSIDSATGTVFGSTPASPTGAYDISKALNALGTTLGVGSHTLKLWVDETNNGDTANVADADEPTATVTVNVIADPANVSVAKTLATFVGVGGKDTGANDNDYLAGAAATPGAKLTVLDTTAPTAKPVAGAKVRFDVYAGDPATTGVYQLSLVGTSDASGNISISAPLTADQTKALSAAGGLFVKAFISQSSVKNVGTSIGTAKIAEFSAPTYNVALAGGATKLQATKGSTVTVNLVETDQFGNPAVGHVLTVSGGTAPNAAPGAPNDRLAATNAQGQTSFTYTDKRGTVASPGDTFTFHDLGNGSSDPVDTTDASVQVDYVNTLTAASITANGAFPAATTPGNEIPVSATATAPYSVVVKNTDGVALANTKVTFTVDNGFLSTTSGGKGTAKSVDVTTDANGIATAYAGSEKAGNQTVSITSGAAPALNGNKQVYEALGFYHLDVTPSGDITTNSTGKVTIAAVDKFGNPVSYEWFDITQSGAGSLPNGTSSQEVSTGATGTVTVSVDGGPVAGAGSLVVTDEAYGTSPVTADTTSPATVANYAGPQTVTYNVVAPTVPVQHPTAAEKKLAADTAKLSKDTAALASAKSKLSKDTAKLAKDKKALKHAKGAKKKALKKAIKAVKKAIAADKKAVSAATSAITADNKAIAADKAAIAAGK